MLAFTPNRRILAFAIVAALIIAAAGAAAHHWVQRSHIATQERVAEGWSAAGLVITNHRIQRGENFWGVAKQYGADIDSIVGANPGIAKLTAAAGQTVAVPNRRGTLHRCVEGDSVDSLATLYGKPAAEIRELNNLTPKSVLLPGLTLFIAGAKPVKLSGEMAASYGLRGIFGSPFQGRITSAMGLRKHPVGGFRGKHTGIDVAAREGTRIAAAAAGTVTQTGEGEFIGKFVVLKHANGYSTIYGHCSAILTAAGKSVKKGQIIAKVGNTGRTTGPHLHFEIRKNGVPQNPLDYLW